MRVDLCHRTQAAFYSTSSVTRSRCIWYDYGLKGRYWLGLRVEVNRSSTPTLPCLRWYRAKTIISEGVLLGSMQISFPSVEGQWQHRLYQQIATMAAMEYWNSGCNNNNMLKHEAWRFDLLWGDNIRQLLAGSQRDIVGDQYICHINNKPSALAWG